MTTARSHETEYFQLVEGYYQDFEDEDLEGWTYGCLDPAFEDHVSITTSNGQLRIHGTWSGSRQTFCLYTNLALSNYIASMDILDWEDSPGSQLLCAIMMRFQTGAVATNQPHYYGGITVQASNAPPQSSVWVFKWWGDNGASGGEEYFSPMDPANDYRLICHLVGGQLTAEVYDLADLNAPLKTVTGIDNNPLARGWSGIFANDKGWLESLDVTVDSFVIYATP